MHRRAGSAEGKWCPSRKTTIHLVRRVSEGLYENVPTHSLSCAILWVWFMSVYMYISCGQEHVREHVHRGQRSTLASSFSILDFKRSLLLSWKVTNGQILLVNKPRIHLSPAQSTRVTGTCPQAQFEIFYYYLCVQVFCLTTCLCTMYMQCPQRPE